MVLGVCVWCVVGWCGGVVFSGGAVCVRSEVVVCLRVFIFFMGVGGQRMVCDSCDTCWGWISHQLPCLWLDFPQQLPRGHEFLNIFFLANNSHPASGISRTTPKIDIHNVVGVI